MDDKNDFYTFLIASKELAGLGLERSCTLGINLNLGYLLMKIHPTSIKKFYDVYYLTIST